jgi:putative SOS response-associated peptidase YedK
MWDTWLDPTNQHVEVLSKLLVPAPEELLEMHEVSTDVNNVRNNRPELIEPI